MANSNGNLDFFWCGKTVHCLNLIQASVTKSSIKSEPAMYELFWDKFCEFFHLIRRTQTLGLNRFEKIEMIFNRYEAME